MAISNELVSLANSLVAVKEACNEALEAKGASAVNCLNEIANAISGIEGGGFEEPQFYGVFRQNGTLQYMKLGDRTKPYTTGALLNRFTDLFSLISDTEVELYVNIKGRYADTFVENLVGLISDYGIDTSTLTVYGAYDLVNKVYYWGEIDVELSIEEEDVRWIEGSRDDEKGVMPASEEA